jgi:hypothetical protein
MTSALLLWRFKQFLAIQYLAVLLGTWVGLSPHQSEQPHSAAQGEGNAAETMSSAPPAQPLPYSHKKHVSFGMKCKDCHTNPDPGSQMSFPPTELCMNCHITIAKEKPAIKKLAEFAKSKQRIPWVRVYAVPSFVYWSHRTHLDADLKCETCHGPVGQMDVVAQVTNVTTMAGCVDCHREKEASTGCQTCHEMTSAQSTSPGVKSVSPISWLWPHKDDQTGANLFTVAANGSLKFRVARVACSQEQGGTSSAAGVHRAEGRGEATQVRLIRTRDRVE